MAQLTGVAKQVSCGHGTTASKVEGKALASFTNLGVFQVLGQANAVGIEFAAAGA